jgi:hypothetical protein
MAGFVRIRFADITLSACRSVAMREYSGADRAKERGAAAPGRIAAPVS